MIDYLVNETDGLPFETAFDGLYFIDRMISSSNFFVYNSFKQYFKELLKNSYAKLGWKLNLTDFTQMLV